MRPLLMPLLLFALASAAACGAPAVRPAPTGAPPELTGTIELSEPATLPADAIVQVQLVDLRTGSLLAQQTLTGPGRLPIPFALRYSPLIVTPEREMGVQVRITGDPVLRWATPEPVPVRPDDAEPISVVVFPAELPAPGPEASTRSSRCEGLRFDAPCAAAVVRD